MYPSVAFTTAAPLSIRHRYVIANRETVCSISPNQTSNPPTKSAKAPEKKSKISHFSVLSPDSDKKALTQPPFHRSFPVVGYILEDLFGLSNYWKRAAQYGPVYQSNFLVEESVFVTKYAAIVDMSRDPETFQNKGSFDAFGILFGNDNLLLLDGAPHMASRSVISGAFSPTLFPFYFDAITRRVNRTWSNAQNSVRANDRLLLDPVCREHYLSIIVEMTTGIDMESGIASELRTKFLKVQRAFFSPPVGPIWNAGIRARESLMVTLEELVRESLISKADIIEKLREYGEKLTYYGGKDIIKGDVNVMLIAIANSGLSSGPEQENDPAEIENIANLIILLWFAGYATAAATTACATFELGMNKDIWDQLVAEQDDIVAAHGGLREVTYEQANEMPLLDSYISEILRLHPAVAFLARKSIKDIEMYGHFIPSGSSITLDIAAAMRDPEIYEDPHTLRVDRFVKKEGKPQPPKILSFGAPGSPHYCIGTALARLLMKATLSVLLRDYILKLDPHQSRNYSAVPEPTPQSKVVCIGIESRN